MGKPERFVLIAGGVVLAVVVLAVLVIVAVGGPKTADYDRASPEGVVQRYLQAVQRGDAEAVHELLSRRARKQVEDNGGWGVYRPGWPDNQRVTLERTEVTGDRAVVRLRIENASGSGLSFDRYSWTVTVPLVRESGHWLIDDPYALPF